jgi:mono/diheme cytochrome c family protein
VINLAKAHNRPRRLKGVILGLAIVVGLVAAGCTSGSYPVDIFYEMHYQQSYKSHEPPRLAAVENAVAFFPAPASTSDSSGAHLFQVNCQMCHGPGAKGDGPVLTKMIDIYGYTPIVSPNITTRPFGTIDSTLSRTTRPLGPTSVMPPFGKLLSSDERAAIAEYIGTLPK